MNIGCMSLFVSAKYTSYLVLVFLRFVFVLLAFPATLFAKTDLNVVSISTAIKFFPLEEHVLGFNSPMGMANLTHGDYASVKLLKGAAKLPANALRYPGGTVANYFDWGTQSLDADVIKKVGKPSILRLLRLDLERNDGGLTV